MLLLECLAGVMVYLGIGLAAAAIMCTRTPGADGVDFLLIVFFWPAILVAFLILLVLMFLVAMIP